MLTTLRRTLVAGCALLLAAAPAAASELRGSPSSMVRQHREALEQDYTFVRTPAQVERLTDLGRLEAIEENEELALSKVSFPYARAEVRGFVERLAGEYLRETGSRLVITSLTRPKAAQPGNAHRLSVHPAGMAVDLRVPAVREHRDWLEARLLELEELEVIDATRERNPPHYHVAVFAEAFEAYAGQLEPLPPLAVAAVAASQPSPAMETEEADQPVQAGQPVTTTGASNAEASITLALMLLLVGGTAVRRHAVQVFR